jgi:transcription initiation factor TFIIB
MAIEILAKVKGDQRLVGKRPISLAAAALYLASTKNGDRTTQLRLAYAAGVTPITIRKRSLEISDILGVSG